MFNSGDIVICINDSDVLPILHQIEVGKIYTIRTCIPGKDHRTLEPGFGVMLQGIYNPLTEEGQEWCYVAIRFQKIGESEPNIFDKEVVENEQYDFA
jgi:hypothetical protein